MSRYSWHVNSFDLSGAIPTTPQVLSVTIPAGSTVKRFQLRNNYISMYNQSTDASHVRAPYMSIVIDYIGLFTPARTIYQSHRLIPYLWTTFEAVAIPVYDYQAGAGDLELGVDQPCSYGKLTDPEAFVQLTTFIFGHPSLPSDYTGTWETELAALAFH